MKYKILVLILFITSTPGLCQVLDDSFNTRLTKSGNGFTWRNFFVDPNGQLNLKGDFDLVNGNNVNGFFRLTESLEPDFSLTINPNYTVWGFQSTGKIVVSQFDSVYTVLRLNADGTLDNSFSAISLICNDVGTPLML